MKSRSRTLTTLWKVTVGAFLTIVICYLFIEIILPSPKEPNPISMEGAIFERVFDRYNDQFVALYVTKKLSNQESSRYIQEWKNLNVGFNARDLRELVGFDRSIETISDIRFLVVIDCRYGTYFRYKEEYCDVQGRIIHGTSSDSKHGTWNRIPRGSTIDELANQFCERSAY